MGRRFACSVGRGGIIAADKKREGDGGTPAGTHKIVGMLYRPDRMVQTCGLGFADRVGRFLVR